MNRQTKRFINRLSQKDIEKLWCLSALLYLTYLNDYLNETNLENNALDNSLVLDINTLVLCVNNSPIAYTDPNGTFVLTATLLFLTGAIIAGLSSIVVQGLTVGWDNINWGQVGIDALFGGFIGLLSISGMSVLGMAFWTGALSMGNYWTVQAYRGEDITVWGSLLSFGLGFAFGAMGGNGLTHGKGNYNKLLGLDRTVMSAFKRQGLRAAVDTYTRTLGRHFLNQAMLHSAKTGGIKFFADVTNYAVLNYLLA